MLSLFADGNTERFIHFGGEIDKFPTKTILIKGNCVGEGTDYMGFLHTIH